MQKVSSNSNFSGQLAGARVDSIGAIGPRRTINAGPVDVYSKVDFGPSAAALGAQLNALVLSTSPSPGAQQMTAKLGTAMLDLFSLLG